MVTDSSVPNGSDKQYLFLLREQIITTTEEDAHPSLGEDSAVNAMKYIINHTVTYDPLE